MALGENSGVRVITMDLSSGTSPRIGGKMQGEKVKDEGADLKIQRRGSERKASLETKTGIGKDMNQESAC